MALGAGATTKFVLPAEPPEMENGVFRIAHNAFRIERNAFRIERVENVKDVENYLGRVDEMIDRKIRKMEELSWH